MDPQNVEAEDLLCDESFQRYCRGENHADVMFWEAWINKHPDKLSVVANAKRLYKVLNLEQGDLIEQSALLKDALARQSLFKEEVLKKQEVTSSRPGQVIKFNRKSFINYAASLILLIFLGALFYTIRDVKINGQLHNYEYYTRSNIHKTIMLPDSSIVMLNENSHLSINKDFSAQHREVSITGEAFFNIKHDAAHPFIVNTRQYSIKVLGTTFNVKSYPGDRTETTLLTGKIEIFQGTDIHSDRRIVLAPDQKFFLKENSSIKDQLNANVLLTMGTIVRSGIDSSTHLPVETSWARRKMVIYDKSFDEIAEQLESWYGMKIKFKDNGIKNYRYTATIDDETIFDVLRYLQRSYPFNYTIQNDYIVITRSKK